MPAQQASASVAAPTQTAALGAPPSNLGSLPANDTTPRPQPTQAAATSGGGTYTHTIQSGESLYTIARRYDVTTQSLVHANALSSPDRIVVGQKLVIPGRSDLLGTQATTPAPAQPQRTEVASVTPAQPTPVAAPAEPAQQAQATQQQVQPQQPEPTQQASAPKASTPTPEPSMSGADNFRWPANGRVITDFAASKGTGINIELPEGTSVQAAENGTVIYTGSGVEGYGNLVLVRHPNGYVSAYAHLKSIGVNKGQVVSRGDAIGSSGMTGSVSRPQLHFELRKGATPVDPMPLLG
ncbi:hypothetical protein GCM10007989_01680 [Devosia pacifica]|uniref:LysM domain-containing protein n=1 Tax=Devosia pacifica TaxID=1335967 RepID=A0A918RVM5_9HYPH|nr:M23 family metallopeptidase [Devosia pacifica]GHA11036.1 hypothetical protein GCM10007989_01680 [Devosia pacifica]